MRSSLGNIITIAKREVSGYFASPVAYVFIVIFLLLVGFFTFMVSRIFRAWTGQSRNVFAWHPWLYLFLVPAVGMRMWSEERRLGTIELLLTMPVTPWQAIVGKFIASWVVLILALALTFPLVITVNYLGHPDNGIIAAGYLGSVLLSGASPRDRGHDFGYDAQPGGQLHSLSRALSVSNSRRLATGNRSALVRWANPWFVQAVSAFSVMTHFDAIQKGVLDSRDILYFISVIVFASSPRA